MTVEDILTELVAFKTVAGNDDEFTTCFNYLEDFLARRGLVVKRHESEGHESIVATSLDTKIPKVLLQAHIDVVPAGDAGFKLRPDQGRLYGRGTYDMKFAAACFLLLVEELKTEIANYDFGLMLTSDEEIGGHNGCEMLLDSGYGAEVCILPDGGDNWAIETVCNGIWIVDVTAEGVSAHGSRPWEGENAIDKVMAGVENIRKVFGQPIAGQNSFTLSQLHGGSAINQVPDKASATMDLRFISSEDFKKLRSRIEEITNQAGLNLTTRADVDVCTTDLEEPYTAKFVSVVEKLRGQPIKQARSLGASDSRHFTAKGIPTILIRPDGGGPHSDNEWIDQAGLRQFYDVIKTYVIETARKT